MKKFVLIIITLFILLISSGCYNYKEINDMAIVTDATAPTYLGALIRGGAVVTPVWHNGTIWVAR